MKKINRLSSNMEDYLEAVAFLREKHKVARVRDISRLLDVKASSVTSALEYLSRNKLVIHERYGYVQLTPEGKRVADDVIKRHEILAKFLTKILGIDYKTAKVDACKMEHSISPRSFERLTKFIEFIETSPSGERPEWLRGFDYYLKTGKRQRCKIRSFKKVRA